MGNIIIMGFMVIFTFFLQIFYFFVTFPHPIRTILYSERNHHDFKNHDDHFIVPACSGWILKGDSHEKNK